MPVTPAAVEDEITSSLYNEIVSFINGTTPESGSANPGKFIRFSSASAYGVTAGNADTTNGFAFKAQYGDPDGTPTTLFTVAKAAIDHAVKATFLTTGIGIESIAEALPIGYGPSTLSATRFQLSEGTTSVPVTSETPMFRLHRINTPTTTLAARVFADVDISSVSQGVVSGALGNGGRSNNYGIAVSKIMSSTGVEHSGYAAIFHATANPGTNADVNVNAVLALAYCGPRGGQVFEPDLVNSSGGTAPTIAVSAESPAQYNGTTVPIGTTTAMNTLTQAVGTGSNYVTACHIYQATSGNTGTLDGGANAGHYPFPGAIRNGRYFLDLPGLSGTFAGIGTVSARPMRIANNAAIYGLNAVRDTDLPIIKIDTSDRVALESATGIFLGSVGGAATYLLANSGGVFTVAALQSAYTTATTGGGAQTLRLGASGPHVYCGSGVPTISAVQGSLYLRTEGSSGSTRAYINTNGSTGWTAITTAS